MTRSSKGTYGITRLTVEVGYVEPWVVGLASDQRWVHLKWKGSSESLNGTHPSPLVTAQINSANFQSVGNNMDAVGAQAGTQRYLVSFAPFSGKMRAYISFTGAGITTSDRTYFYADQTFEVNILLPGGTNGSLYEIYQGASHVATVRIAPDDNYNWHHESTSDESYQVYRRAAEKGMMDGFWTFIPGQREASSSGGGAPVPKGATSGAGSSGSPHAGAPPGGSGTITTGETGGTNNPTGNEWTGTGNQGTLTGQVFKEGVDGIVKAIKANGSGGGGSGGDGVDHDGIIGDNPTPAETSAGGSSAGSSVAGLIPDAALGTAGGFTPSTSAPDWTVAMMGHEVDMDPFKSDRFGPIASFLKAGLAWACIVWFGVWATKETSAMLRGMAAARQAQGNAVAAGTGAQATALVAAATITVAFLAGVTGLMAFLSHDFGAGSILGMFTESPYDGIPGGVAYCLDQCFPLGVAAACLIGRVAWSLTAQSIFGVFASVVRFVVP